MSTKTDQTPVTEDRKIPFLYDGMLIPFVLLVTCFAAWGIAANMTDPLVGVFRNVFSMTTVQSTLVQSAYYGAYFLLAIPAAFINSRFSYKVGVLVGLALAAVGGSLFIPAANVMTYGLFLAALFTLAAGLSILETSANPFVLSMGPEGNATRRLNFAQAFNPVGVNIGVLLAATIILPNISELSDSERDALSESERIALRSDELQAVMTPYVGLAILLVLIWIGIAFMKVPGQPVRATHEVDPRGSKGRFMRLVRNKHYSFGVVAQYFNVAAQTCIWTFTILYVEQAVDATNTEQGRWLQASVLVFLVSRFVMVWLMGTFDSRVLMLTMTCLGVVLCAVVILSPNLVGAVAVVLLSACLSLLFPTIYGIALEGLGEDAKFGAAGLVMAIVGGATIPLIQGALIDATSPAVSFIVPAVCFMVIIAYTVYVLRTPRPIEEAVSHPAHHIPGVGDASHGDHY
jgi:FHS family L-fucose permease-like MFS transporter